MNIISSNINLLMEIRRISKNQKLNADKIKALQEKKLKNLLNYVLVNSNFYKRYYGNYGITIDNINDISLKDLPIIDKKIVMENFDDLICDKNIKKEELEKFISNPNNRYKKFKNHYTVVHSSGSSGEVGIFANNAKEWNVVTALSIERASQTKLNIFQRKRVAYIGASDGNYAGVTLNQGLPSLFCNILILNINSPLQDIMEKINDFQPEFLSGYASGIYMLAQGQMKKNIKISPKEIICGGDTLTELMRSEITKAFKVKPINFYAASEALGMGCDCVEHHNIHLFSDYYCFEVVDKNQIPVLSGSSGNLIMTNLFNYTQPLIRYKLNDEVILDSSTCNCQCQLPVLKSISGRQEDFLWFEKSDGTKECIHPIVLVEFYVEGIIKFKFIQVSNKAFIMKAVINGEEEKVVKEINNRIKEILNSKGLDKDVTFSVEVVSDIENDIKTGKYKLIVPLK